MRALSQVALFPIDHPRGRPTMPSKNDLAWHIGVATIRSVRHSSGTALPYNVNTEAGTLSVDLGAFAVRGVVFVVDYEASTPIGFRTPACLLSSEQECPRFSPRSSRQLSSSTRTPGPRQPIWHAPSTETARNPSRSLRLRPLLQSVKQRSRGGKSPTWSRVLPLTPQRPIGDRLQSVVEAAAVLYFSCAAQRFRPLRVPLELPCDRASQWRG